MKNILLFFFLSLTFVVTGQKKIKTSSSFKKEIRKHRKHYKKEFSKDQRSPFYKDKKGMKDFRFFKADEKYRFVGKFKRTPDAVPFDMATYSGITKPYVMYGVATIQIDGKVHRVHLYQNLNLRKIKGYKDYLFIPFKDITNDDDITYGGGRYIDLKIGDIKDNKVVIDFNKCYNPWCAYSDGYNCPVPPIENHLEFEVNAGEKKFVGAKRKRKQ